MTTPGTVPHTAVMRAVMALLVFSACSLDLGRGDDGSPIPDAEWACTADLRPGLMIVVTAEDGTPIGDARITVSDSVFSEVLEADAFSGTYRGAWERPGVYTIRVERPGFVTVQLASIEVTADACHVVTEALTIVMVPSPR